MASVAMRKTDSSLPEATDRSTHRLSTEEIEKQTKRKTGAAIRAGRDILTPKETR